MKRHIKKWYILLAGLAAPFFACAKTLPNTVQYESGEHIFIGNQVILKGIPSLPAKRLPKFTLANGLKMTYGELLSMPDFYGDPNHQISSEPTYQKRQQRFLRLFSDFSKYDTSYFNKFWPIVQDERKKVAAALKAHQSVSKMYAKLAGKEIFALALVTNFRYIELAAKCFDHFSENAILAYQAGHSAAIDTALLGYQIADGENIKSNANCKQAKNIKTCLMLHADQKLKLAYEENAYASHFLSDRFASGHMRTPFQALTTTRPISALGGIAGNYMHNEDNSDGVIVTNNSGKYWIAYGDDYYFSAKNVTNKAVLKKVLQKSADEIYAAFEKGYDMDPESANLLKMVPQPIVPGKTVDIPGIGSVTETAPLYKMQAGAVWERKDVNNIYDNQWVQNWTTTQMMLTYHLKPLSARWRLLISHNHIPVPF